MNASLDDDDALPAWAQILGKQGYRSFIRLIRNYFANRNIKAAIDSEEGVVKPELENFHLSSTFGLQNIAQICYHADRDEWFDLISAHFNSIFEVKAEDNALHVNMDDLQKVRSQLRSRLYPVEIVNHTTEIIHRSGPEGTLEVLALDLPTTVRTISRSETAAWRLDDDELFQIGRQNLKQAGLLKSSSVQLEQGTAVNVYTGDPFYTASHVLILDEYLPLDNIHGALVGVPKRDTLITHLIQNIGVIDAASAMLQIVVGMYRDGPGSISPNLYWYKNGEFIVLPYELEDKTLRIVPPDDFIELIDELSEVATYT